MKIAYKKIADMFNNSLILLINKLDKLNKLIEKIINASIILEVLIILSYMIFPNIASILNIFLFAFPTTMILSVITSSVVSDIKKQSNEEYKERFFKSIKKVIEELDKLFEEQQEKEALEATKKAELERQRRLYMEYINNIPHDSGSVCVSESEPPRKYKIKTLSKNISHVKR